jgi:hypothetical protein
MEVRYQVQPVGWGGRDAVAISFAYPSRQPDVPRHMDLAAIDDGRELLRPERRQRGLARGNHMTAEDLVQFHLVPSGTKVGPDRLVAIRGIEGPGPELRPRQAPTDSQRTLRRGIGPALSVLAGEAWAISFPQRRRTHRAAIADAKAIPNSAKTTANSAPEAGVEGPGPTVVAVSGSVGAVVLVGATA